MKDEKLEELLQQVEQAKPRISPDMKESRIELITRLKACVEYFEVTLTKMKESLQDLEEIEFN
ncbi:MAG: hypothetical protein FWE01_03120 [Firmicutes bacterium]|nr:hypothetical protein [Bacillota bacterium]